MDSKVRGRAWVIGYGSLLSERSSRRTFPSLSKFQVAILHGYRRVFCHASPLFLTRGVADLQSRELAALSVERVDDTESEYHRAGILVSVFEVSEEELPALYKREEEFEVAREKVEVLGKDGAVVEDALMCVRSTDEVYAKKLGTAAVWEEKVGQYGLDAIWTDDVLPCRIYLKHCWLAARRLGPAVHDSFLDSTFLSDRTTSMREYLERHPSILDEEAPPQYIDFYSG